MTSSSAVPETTSSARRAYETLEPFHILAYFNPGLRAALADTGLDAHAFYVGARAAPMGAASSAVVASAFYNFSPTLIAESWSRAVDFGLDRLHDRRHAMLDDSLRDILGERAEDPLLDELASAYRDLAADLPLGGRPLAAAWASAPTPGTARLRLWQPIAVLREWRGDNHIAALVLNGLNGFDAAVFHEAHFPDPTIRRRVLGKRLVLMTRGWSEEEWDRSVDRLIAAGLVERLDSPTETDADAGATHRLTAQGAALYDDIEATTDAVSETVWSGADDLVERTRPFVKAVIDAGVLPGTKGKKP